VKFFLSPARSSRTFCPAELLLLFLTELFFFCYNEAKVGVYFFYSETKMELWVRMDTCRLEEVKNPG
jgi:hypothetical protein